MNGNAGVSRIAATEENVLDDGSRRAIPGHSRRGPADVTALFLVGEPPNTRWVALPPETGPGRWRIV